MGSNWKLLKACIEDRISGLPDAILFHIISFLETRDAVKTCLLSHRWNNVWTYVPNLEVYVSSPKYDSDEHVHQAGFVDRVLLFRNLSNIHKFRLICLGIEDYFDRIDAWVCTAIRPNVVELELDLYTTPSNSYTGCLKLPTSIFICKILVVLKLILTDHVIAIPPNSSCFPSLKYLDVQVYYPVADDSVAKLFSCCFSALEGLIIHGNLGRLSDDEVLNLTIPAPKLKRLQMRFCAVPEDDPYARDGGYEYKIFVNANAPNLEKFNVKYLLASYSLKNVKSLSTVELKCKGWGTDEKAIICLLGHRNAAQRKEIRVVYEQLYQDDIIKHLKSELSGDFERAVYRWTLDPADCDAVLANLAIKKPDCNYNVIIEIFSVRCPEELLAVRKAYQLRYKCSLEEDLAQRTNGDLHKLLVALVTAYCCDGNEINVKLANSEANILQDAIKDECFNHEEIIRILSTRSKTQLMATFNKYRDDHGNSISKNFLEDGANDFQKALHTAVRFLNDHKKYFEKVLCKAIIGTGTNEDALTRVIVTRAEKDLKDIMEVYYKNSVSLEQAVAQDTSGDYMTFLLTLLGKEDWDPSLSKFESS